MADAINKGYLLENFRLFHLRDRRAQKMAPHYHEFDKIVVLCAGAVDYTVEGVSYRMQPGDVLFVRHHDIHRPEISPESDYERIVLWITPEFLERSSVDGAWLESCFDLASQRRNCLFRPAAEELARLKKTLSSLESALNDGEEFGASILVNSFFLQLMVELNRAVRSGGGETARSLDPKIDAALYYINTHLGEPMTVDTLAGMCYLSRFYFMRRFKDATGYTVHSYIQQKRLAAAAERLETGAGVTETAMELGFAEYTSFLRAFRKAYGVTPSDYLRKKRGMESEFQE